MYFSKEKDFSLFKGMHDDLMYVRFGGMRNTKTWSKSTTKAESIFCPARVMFWYLADIFFFFFWGGGISCWEVLLLVGSISTSLNFAKHPIKVSYKQDRKVIQSICMS